MYAWIYIYTYVWLYTDTSIPVYIYLCVYIKNIYKLTGDHYGINIKICQIFFIEIRYVLIIIKGKTLTREPEMDKGCCFPHSSVGKESTCNAGDPSLIPGSGRSTVEGIGYPLQYSWASLVAQLVKNPPARRETWVQDLGSTPGLGRSLEKEKAPPTPVFWAGEFHGLVYGGHKELDTTEQLSSLYVREKKKAQETT